MIESVLMTGVAETVSVLATWPLMQKFYLSGGTALALQEGHRRSKDLGFFTRQPLEVLPKLPQLDDLLKRFTLAEWTHKSPEQIDWRLNGVSVTLLAYPFAHNFEFHTWRGLSVADPRDIAVQKAYTIGRRAQARDYIDLHAIIKTGLMTIHEIMSRAQRTYGDAFSPRLFLQQLTYTHDLTDKDKDDAVSLLIEPQSFAIVEQDLQSMVQDWIDALTLRQPRSTEGPHL
ncbi:MAG: nucleotidyl transferase AbiEii/AbiGii toxin family protein [Ferrimicrobium sp.]